MANDQNHPRETEEQRQYGRNWGDQDKQRRKDERETRDEPK